MTKGKKMRMWSVEGNGQWLDGGSMFGNAPKALWSRWCEPDEQGRIRLSCRSMLLETRHGTILCETGIGDYMEPKMSERFGVEPGGHRLLENLSALGKSEDDIDYVILSHLHFDHAGGLLPSYQESRGGDYDLLFKNARYIVGEEAFARAETPHFRDRASFIPHLTEKLKASGRLKIVPKGKNLPELAPEIDFMESHGHTPGQLLTIVRGDSETVIFAGDLIPGVPWVNLPITMGYDRFPELLINEKESLYKTLVPEQWRIFFTHDSNVAVAGVRLNEKGKYEATDPKKNVAEFAL
ncbi:MBL fold metallo-hydrolase [Pseudobacteriovorax antillogorgiicola]|uniref:Glyoxylase, beta-lactamase superfamily II n=1 Tax=Pseudobacteriovorax antillogorgiicola TaxID=1513793 RepID=A0A1Y6CCR6_9BACT|nr:MBL fold metallo-hydrolase [Pseudobacteriovorax antillogorgiicola]TCS48684.1 glyoxylase-like metal-dependent hydrolase (beta-lactamase superfamily II) [Pseudobacteriovorax antillogorgiicola]SMF54844.1 Glyoxylase, beta-lactamase superfamily II [Pseudobacteriovorax antillogorgiicola]